MYRLSAMFIRNLGTFRPIGLTCRWVATASQLPSFGSGVGKGGGAGGSVRELGGAFGQREAAEEEVYFRKLSAHQLEQLHSLHVEEIRYLEKEMREHAEAVQRHKQKLHALKKLTEGSEHENMMDIRVD